MAQVEMSTEQVTHVEPVPAPPFALGALAAVVTLLLLDAGFGLLPDDPVLGVLTPLRLLVIVGLVALAAARPALRTLRTRLDQPILLLVLAALVPAVRSGVGWPGVRALLTTIAAYYLVVALRRLAPSAAGIATVTLVVAATAGCVALTQLTQQVPTGFCRTGWFADAPCSRPGAITRAVGTFANPNLVAAWLVLVTPLGALRAFGRDRQEAVIGGVLLAVAYGGVVATFSRAGYLAAATGLLVLVTAVGLGHRRAGRWAGRGVALLGVLVVVLAGVAAVSGLGVRGEIWAAAVRIGVDHPTGVGLGRAGEVLGVATVSGIPVLHAHDLWLNWFVEAGVLGLVAFTALTLGALVLAVQATLRGSRVAAAALAGLVGFLLLGLVDDPANLNRIALAFWIVLGLAAAEAPPTWRRQLDPARHARLPE